MPLVKKASHRVDSSLKPLQTPSLSNSKVESSIVQEGMKANSSMRRVQTQNTFQVIQDPNLIGGYNPKPEKLAELMKSKPVKASRSVRFGDNDVKEFVRESSELRFDSDKKVIITQNDDLIKEYEADEKFEIPTYKPYESTSNLTEEESYADPAELQDRIDRLKALAENLLQVELADPGEAARYCGRREPP